MPRAVALLIKEGPVHDGIQQRLQQEITQETAEENPDQHILRTQDKRIGHTILHVEKRNDGSQQTSQCAQEKLETELTVVSVTSVVRPL